MSYVRLLAAGHPMPLYEAPAPRVRTVSIGGVRHTIEENGFSVLEHEYYRSAVDELCLTMKPCQYELDLRATEDDLNQFRAYLTAHLTPGEEVELWGLWVGGADEERPIRYRGPLNQFDRETLDLLEECRPVCVTITI